MMKRKRFLRPVRRCKSGCSIARLTAALRDRDEFIKRVL